MGRAGLTSWQTENAKKTMTSPAFLQHNLWLQSMRQESESMRRESESNHDCCDCYSNGNFGIADAASGFDGRIYRSLGVAFEHTLDIRDEAFNESVDMYSLHAQPQFVDVDDFDGPVYRSLGVAFEGDAQAPAESTPCAPRPPLLRRQNAFLDFRSTVSDV